MSEKIDGIIDQIEQLNVLDLNSLVKTIEEKWDVSAAAAAAPVMMAGPAGAGVEEQTEFDVIMTGFGDKKLDVVKIVKALTGSTLMEAKKLVEAAPATIKEKASKEDADKAKADLEKAGASVELK